MKENKEKEQSISCLWDNIKQYDMGVIRIQNRKREAQKKIF